MCSGHAVTKHLPSLLLVLTIATPATAAKSYLWYDETGQAVYSQFAPKDDAPTQLIKPPPPPAESPEVAQKRLQEQIQRSADFFEDKELAEQEQAKAADQAGQQKQRCEAARSNLADLTGPPNRMYRKSDGSYQRLDEEQREQRRKEMEKAISDNCK